MRLATILALFSLLTLTASAQSRQIVIDQMDYASVIFTADNYVASVSAGTHPMVGLLAGGTRAYVELELEAGREYLISGACDEDCDDLDLVLRAEEGDVLVQDDEVDDVPIITFTPAASGRYLLGVGMIDCETELCYFGYRVFEKTIKI